MVPVDGMFHSHTNVELALWPANSCTEHRSLADNETCLARAASWWPEAVHEERVSFAGVNKDTGQDAVCVVEPALGTAPSCLDPRTLLVVARDAPAV